MKHFGHDPEDDDVDPYSKKTWQDLDQVSAVMAAKEKQDELAAVRDMRKRRRDMQAHCRCKESRAAAAHRGCLQEGTRGRPQGRGSPI